MKNKQMKKETAVVHKGYDTSIHHDSLSVPLYQTSTFAFSTAEQGEKRFAGEEGGNIYSRLGNPTVRVLGRAYGGTWRMDKAHWHLGRGWPQSAQY